MIYIYIYNSDLQFEFTFLQTDNFLNQFPVKSDVVCKLLSKFGMFTCVRFIYTYLDFWIFGGGNKKKGDDFQMGGRTKLGGSYGLSA